HGVFISEIEVRVKLLAGSVDALDGDLRSEYRVKRQTVRNATSSQDRSSSRVSGHVWCIGSRVLNRVGGVHQTLSHRSNRIAGKWVDAVDDTVIQGARKGWLNLCQHFLNHTNL